MSKVKTKTSKVYMGVNMGVWSFFWVSKRGIRIRGKGLIIRDKW